MASLYECWILLKLPKRGGAIETLDGKYVPTTPRIAASNGWGVARPAA